MLVPWWCVQVAFCFQNVVLLVALSLGYDWFGSLVQIPYNEH